MTDKITQFLDCFPTIQFEVQEEQPKSQLSLETMSTGEREIQHMLNRAQRDLNKAKKDHKRGKISSEELFDYEWRVHELRDELDRFKQNNSIDDLDDLEDII